MKKLLLLPVLILVLASCEKEEDQQHCWECKNTKTTKDQFDNNTTVIETQEQCDMTRYEIDRYADRYKARDLLNAKYGDMKCEQLPDKE